MLPPALVSTRPQLGWGQPCTSCYPSPVCLHCFPVPRRLGRSSRGSTPRRVAQVVSTVKPKEVKPEPTTSSGGSKETFPWFSRWWPLIVAKDVEAGIPQHVDLLDLSLVIWRDAQGSVHCVEDKCPHRLAPLSEGRVEGNDLMCSYHGWTFSGSGACVDIPQLRSDPRAMASACSNRRSCVTAYPVHIYDGLVWIWPEPGHTAALTAAATPPLDTTNSKVLPDWFYRDLPLRFDTLVENLLDPSHLAFAHHNWQGNRTRPWQFGQLACSEMESSGFVARDESMRGFQFKFEAPYYVRYDTGGVLQVAMIPLKPGWTRLLFRRSAETGSVAVFNQMRWLVPLEEFITRLCPALDHTLVRNAVLDQDTFFLHALERQLPLDQGVGLDAVEQKEFMPPPADSAVVAFRRWIQEYAGDIPTMRPQDESRMPPLMAKEQALDRYEQHTRHCHHCKSTLAAVEKGRMVCWVLAGVAAAAVVGQAAVAAAVAYLQPAASQAPSLLGTLGAWASQVAALGLSGPLAGAVVVGLLAAAACAGLTAFRKEFFYKGWVHALNH